MTQRAEEPEAVRLAPPADLDREHLDRHTFGDRGLQREVLRLFVAECAGQFERIGNAADARERREAAHRLVGAARGVGAFYVAETARAIEHAAGPADGEIASLKAAIDAARNAIAQFLAD